MVRSIEGVGLFGALSATCRKGWRRPLGEAGAVWSGARPAFALARVWLVASGSGVAGTEPQAEPG